MINLGKSKIYWVALAIAAYLVIGLITTGNLLVTLGYIITILAILNFSKHTVLSIGLFTLAKLCDIGGFIQLQGTFKDMQTMITELLILTIGLLFNLIYIGYKIKRNKIQLGRSLREKVIKFIGYGVKPIKLRFIFRIIIYSMIVITCMSVPKLGGSDTTLLTSVLVMAPTFYILMTILRLPQMYLIRAVEQVGYLILVCMQLSLGETNYLSAIPYAITLIIIVIGYIDHIKTTIIEKKKIL